MKNKLSIICTMYKSGPFVNEFVSRIEKVLDSELINNYEIILVNDGCPMNSLDIAIELSINNNNVKVVELTRNIGHHPAMMTGLSFCTGDIVFLTDIDLEEEPENLTLFLKEMRETNNDVIYGRIAYSKKRLTSALFYLLYNYLTDVKVKEGYLVSRLMKADYVNELLRFKEKVLFIPGIWELAGFRQSSINITKFIRKSESNYSLSKKLQLAQVAILSFSVKPLDIIFKLGLLLTSLAVIGALVVIIKKVFFGVGIIGWASIFMLNLFIGGVIIFSLGIIGKYISIIFLEVKNRPYNGIRGIYKNGKKIN